MSTERLIASHLRLAREAFTAAQSLAALENRNAAYLAEQAVEQMILALAQAEGVHFTRSQHHQLETMRRALDERGAFRDALAQLTWLESCATTYRYPRTNGGIVEAPDRTRLLASIETSGTLISKLADHFGVDLRDGAKSPAVRIDPPLKSSG